MKKFIQENLVDLLLLIGILQISIGCFLWSIILGFIVTGILCIGLSFLLLKGV